MYRVVLFALAGAVIFLGIYMLFSFGGPVGWVMGGVFVVLGSVLIWIFEKKTAHQLDENTTVNQFMKADGENILEERSEE